MPAEHVMHSAAAAEGWYLPSGHSAQAEPDQNWSAAQEAWSASAPGTERETVRRSSRVEQEEEEEKKKERV